MTFLFWLVMLLLAAWLIRAWLVQIDAAHIGVETLFGGRFFFGQNKMRVLPEGLRWRTLPWPISFIDLISLERDRDTFDVKTYTQYGESRQTKYGETAEVVWKVTLLWRPYPHVLLLQRYYELSGIGRKPKGQRPRAFYC